MADASSKEKSEQEGTEKQRETNYEPLSDEEERFLLSDQWFQPKQIEEELDQDGDEGDDGNGDIPCDSGDSAPSPAARKTSRDEVIQSMRRPTIPKGFVHQRVKQASSNPFTDLLLFIPL